MTGLRGKYFVDFLSSFAWGNPDYVEGWKAFVREQENAENKVVAFVIPKKFEGDLIFNIEKLIQEKCQDISN